MTETKQTHTPWVGLAVILFLVVLAAGVGYYFGVAAGEETPTATCALCGGPPSEHAVTVLPNETTPFTEPVTVCAPCYRQAVGVDEQEEGEDKTQTSP